MTLDERESDVCTCGHVYDEHDDDGACLAFLATRYADVPCPCVAFEPD